MQSSTTVATISTTQRTTTTPTTTTTAKYVPQTTRLPNHTTRNNVALIPTSPSLPSKLEPEYIEEYYDYLEDEITPSSKIITSSAKPVTTSPYHHSQPQYYRDQNNNNNNNNKQQQQHQQQVSYQTQNYHQMPSSFKPSNQQVQHQQHQTIQKVPSPFNAPFNLQKRPSSPQQQQQQQQSYSQYNYGKFFESV